MHEKVSAALRVLRTRRAPPGISEIRKGLYLDILEGWQVNEHNHIVGSFPKQDFVEKSFESGPVFVVVADSSVSDIDTGVVILDGQVILETFVTAKLIERYNLPSPAAV